MNTFFAERPGEAGVAHADEPGQRVRLDETGAVDAADRAVAVHARVKGIGG